MDTASAPPDLPQASPRALAYPAFRRYYVGAVAGTNGGWVQRILMSWLAWDLTHSASFVGLIASVTLLPVAVLGPLFGAATDRATIGVAFRRVSVLLLAVPVTLAALLGLGLMTPQALFAVAVLFGVVMAAYHPVRQSLGPRLVEKPAIASVVALAALNFNVGRLLAPALGGVVIAGAGEFATALITVALALPNALIAPTLSPRESPKRTASAGFLADLTEGFAVVWTRWPLRRALLLSVTAIGMIRAISEILAIIADGEFGRGAGGLGLLTSAVGAGALAAAVVQVWAPPGFTRDTRLQALAIATGFAGVAGLAFAPSFALAAVVAPLVGFASTWLGVSLQVAIQAGIEDELRGRVMSIWMLANTASTSALAFAISSLTDWIGIGPAAGLMLALCAVAAGAVLARPARA